MNARILSQGGKRHSVDENCQEAKDANQRSPSEQNEDMLQINRRENAEAMHLSRHEQASGCAQDGGATQKNRLKQNQRVQPVCTQEQKEGSTQLGGQEPNEREVQTNKRE